MNFFKPQLDAGLSTNNIDAVLRFWREEVGAVPGQIYSLRAGQSQHQHDLAGTTLRINHFEAALPQTPPPGYYELVVARPGRSASLKDPDGNRVSLVEPGTYGVTQVGLKIGVRDLEAHRRLYCDGWGFEELPYEGGAAFRAGDSVLLLEPKPDATIDAPYEGSGWRILAFQVRSVDEEHAKGVAAGGQERLAPSAHGAVRVSVVRDPDGNMIELMERVG
jgi:lactoylglutathione lyase